MALVAFNLLNAVRQLHAAEINYDAAYAETKDAHERAWPIDREHRSCIDRIAYFLWYAPYRGVWARVCTNGVH